MESHPGREGKTQGREARKAALIRVQVIAERHLDGGGVRVADHGDAETVMGFRRQSSRDGVIDQNGVWGGNHLGQLNFLAWMMSGVWCCLRGRRGEKKQLVGMGVGG